MHNLINIFAQLLWLSSPPSGFYRLSLALIPWRGSCPLPFPALFAIHLRDQCIKTTSCTPKDLQCDRLGLYVHEVQPCNTERLAREQIGFRPVMSFFFLFGVTSTHTPCAGNVTLEKRRIFFLLLKKWTPYIGKCRYYGGMSGSGYNHLNVMFPAESPSDVGPFLFFFSSSRTDDNHNSICVYIYINFFFRLFRIMSCRYVQYHYHFILDANHQETA